MSRDGEVGLLETLLADVEWSAGELQDVDPHDPDGWRAKKVDAKAVLSCLSRVGFHATLMYRISRWLKKRRMPYLSYPLMVLNQTITGAELSHNADIGPGLRILHPMGIYVGSDVKVGFRSTFNQGAAISKSMREGSAEPEIGNYLQLSPGAKIMGGVKVGDRVQVGPNSVLISDSESDERVMGVPAKPIGADEELP